MILAYNGKTPDLEKAAFVAENAVVAGDVTLQQDSSVWFGAVIRGDGPTSRSGNAATSRTAAFCTRIPAIPSPWGIR